MEKLLTVKEIAEYLRLSRETVLRKARKGEMPAIKIGRRFRFVKEQIDDWLLHKVVGTAHILVVDDEPVIGQLFEDTLKQNGYRVSTALSSLKALELLKKHPFDLIFLDLKMPELDGAELFRRIRQINNRVPVVIITGYPDSELMARAMEYGPFLVLKKPFDSSDIVNAVSSFLQQLLSESGR